PSGPPGPLAPAGPAVPGVPGAPFWPSGPGTPVGPSPGVTRSTSPVVSFRINFGARWALPNSNMLSTLPESTSSEPAPMLPRLQFDSTNLMIDDCSVSVLSTEFDFAYGETSGTAGRGRRPQRLSCSTFELSLL